MLVRARECFKKTSKSPKKEIPKVQENCCKTMKKQKDEHRDKEFQPTEIQKDEHRDFGEYYRPELISIGPYHSKSFSAELMEDKQKMDDLKTKMAGLFCHLYPTKDKGRRRIRRRKLFSFDCFRCQLEVEESMKIEPLCKFLEAFQDMIESEGIRNWYEDDPTEEFNGENFLRMMFLDGCFIIMFILCFLSSGLENLGMTKDMITSVQKDIFLLNNQLPFKVIETLRNAVFENNDLHQMLNRYFRYCTIGYNRHFPSGQPKHHLDLHQMLNGYFRCCTIVYNRLFRNQTGSKDKDKDKDGEKDEQPLHLLDLLRITWLGNAKHIKPAHQQEEQSGDEQSRLKKFLDFIKENIKSSKRSKEAGHLFMKGRMFRNIMELTASGIYLRPNSSNLLCDMDFKSRLAGTLTLPRIIIDGSTKTIFLNLIELEKRLDNNYGITSYISFLDSLIDTADDVKLMRSDGVLQHFLDKDEDVADLFNEIGADLVPQHDIYEPVKMKIYHFFESKCRTRVATCFAEAHQVHLRSPWTTIPVLAAIIAIVLTATQTYFAIPRPNL